MTTAELWRLRPGTTVEGIRKANDIIEVAEAHDVLVLRKKPDNLDVKHAEAAFGEAFTEAELKKLHALVDASGRGGLARLISYVVNRPSLFLVIQYQGFRSAMADLHKFFEQAHLVQPRAKESEKG